MVAEQIEDFVCRDRFVHMVLGIVGLSERLSVLAAFPRPDGGVASDGSLADFFLGVISVGRTLRATLSCDDQNQPVQTMGEATPGDPAEPPNDRTGLLR